MGAPGETVTWNSKSSHGDGWEICMTDTEYKAPTTAPTTEPPTEEIEEGVYGAQTNPKAIVLSEMSTGMVITLVLSSSFIVIVCCGFLGFCVFRKLGKNTASKNVSKESNTEEVVVVDAAVLHVNSEAAAEGTSRQPDASAQSPPTYLDVFPSAPPQSPKRFTGSILIE